MKEVNLGFSLGKQSGWEMRDIKRGTVVGRIFWVLNALGFVSKDIRGEVVYANGNPEGRHFRDTEI